MDKLTMKYVLRCCILLSAMMFTGHATAQGFVCRVRGVDLQTVFDAPTVGRAHVSMFYHLVAAGYANRPDVFRGIMCKPLTH